MGLGAAISELGPATTLNDADVFEIEQGGVSKRITKSQLSVLLTPPVSEYVSLGGALLPQQFGVLSYNDSADFVCEEVPRWREVPRAAYDLAPPTNHTITFLGGGTVAGIKLNGGDYFSVGIPVRVIFENGATCHGICDDVTDTLLTFNGWAFPPAQAIYSVSIGTPDMVKHVQMCFDGTGYNSHVSNPLTRGCRHRWHGATGYLACFSCAHMNTSNGTQVNLQFNGSAFNVCGPGVFPAAGTSTTYGAFVNSALGIMFATAFISNNQLITVKTPTLGGLADYLIVCMTFVVP